MHDITVCKFGGSSLADAGCFRRVADIIRADRSRKYIVVSAPGKRPGDAHKLTDILINAWEAPDRREEMLALAEARLRGIATDLGLPYTYSLAEHTESRDAIASRGEQICAKLLAAYLDMPYIEAAEIFKFRGNTLDTAATYANIRRMGPCGIIPGFYGSDENGNIVTFPRGGSDITGAHVAAATGAALYENWTDVNGFFTADPAIVEDARHIPHMDYRLAELYSYLGANVLQYASVLPASEANVPILVRNTFSPNSLGTIISSDGFCEMPCIASRALGSDRHLVSAINLSPAMLESARAIPDIKSDHSGMVFTECSGASLNDTIRKLHAHLIAMCPKN